MSKNLFVWIAKNSKNICVFLHLPHCYQISSYDNNNAEAMTREEVGLPEDAFVFCSFNQAVKINAVIFECWVNILKACEGSVLFLVYDNDYSVENLQKEAEIRGVDKKRLIFVKHLPRDRYLERLKLADMSLDTIVYNGGTITADSLWCDVPVITLYGEHFASRMACSLLKNIGLGDLVAGRWMNMRH